MPDPSLAERRQLLVDTTFRSEAFIVAQGKKTPHMMEVEAARAAQAAAQRAAAGAVGPAAKGFAKPPPDPANLAVLDKLANVLKYFVEDDQALLATTKVKFKDHFAGILDPATGQLTLFNACDATYDAAGPSDVTFKELIDLGLDKGCQPPGLDTIAKWVRSAAFGQLMPTGEIADNFYVLTKLVAWDATLARGKLEWNEMDCCITVDRVRVEDNLTSGFIRMAMGERYFVPIQGKKGMRSFVPSDTYVLQAMEHLARQEKFHESREYLQRVEPSWDGVSRIRESLEAIHGIKEVRGTDEEKAWITQCNDLAISQWTKTLIGTAARTFQPGCQMDTMLILKSKQGTKKSSLFRALAPANRFSSAHLEFGSKDSRMSFQQNTWIEIAELSAYQKKDIQLVKAEITERSDDFRLPYGHSSTKNPRHCILLGSTNDDKFLRDPTGSRRFWIITVDDTKQADMVWIEKWKDQLWAEIVVLYKAGFNCAACDAAADGELRCPTHRWWLSKAEDALREKINEIYTETEPYIAWLQDWIANHIATKNTAKQGMHASHKNTDALKVYELLQEVGLSAKECHERAQQNRMIVALRACGYIMRHTENGNVWISPGMQNRPSLKVVNPPVPAVTTQPVSAPASVDGEELKKTGENDS